MPTQRTPTRHGEASRVPAICGAICITVCVIVLIGWQLRIPLLKTIPGNVSVVSPNAALCFIILSTVLLLLRNPQASPAVRWLGKFLAALVLTFGFLTLLEHLYGFNFGIDQVFFQHRLSDWPVPTIPGRFAIQTAFGFTFASLAMVLLDVERYSIRFSEIFAGGAAFAPFVALLGYWYHAKPFYGVMALETALLFCVLVTGLLFLRRNTGIVALLTGQEAANILARHLLIAIPALLVVFGWACIRLQQAGLVDLELGTALLITVCIGAVALAVMYAAHKLDLADKARASANNAVNIQASLLQSSEARLNEGLEAAHAGTWDVNFETGEEYWSRGHYTLLGYDIGEVFPSEQAWLDRIHPEDRENALEDWRASLSSGSGYYSHYRVIWPDGTVHWMEAKAKLIVNEKREPVRSIGGFIEITDRIRSQQALIEAEKLAVTGRMAATLAHEINNPLAAVTNLIFLLRTELKAGDGAVREYLQLADDEIRRVAQLVQKTLSFYRADAAASKVRLAEVLNDIIWLYQKRIREFGIRIVKRIDYEGEVFCNGAEIRQVLTNIIVNAIEAVPREGRIVLHVSRCSWSDRPGVRIVVSDDGPGIPANHRADVFKPFFSLKGDRGTGLGLWISKGILEKNGGSIRFRTKNKAPSGTSFAIFVPDTATNKPTADSQSAAHTA